MNALGDGGELNRLRAGELSAGDFLALLVFLAGESTEGDLGDFLALLVLRAGESIDEDGDLGDFLALRVFLAGESIDDTAGLFREGDLDGLGDLLGEPRPNDTSPVSSIPDLSPPVEMSASKSFKPRLESVTLSSSMASSLRLLPGVFLWWEVNSIISSSSSLAGDFRLDFLEGDLGGFGDLTLSCSTGFWSSENETLDDSFSIAVVGLTLAGRLFLILSRLLFFKLAVRARILAKSSPPMLLRHGIVVFFPDRNEGD